MPLTALALVLLAALLHAAWNIVAKRSGGGTHFVTLGALMLAAISPLGYVLVLYAMQMAPLSHVAPAREVSMLFAALLGGRLLGETDRGARLAGAACIVAGVAALVQ